MKFPEPAPRNPSRVVCEVQLAALVKNTLVLFPPEPFCIEKIRPVLPWRGEQRKKIHFLGKKGKKKKKPQRGEPCKDFCITSLLLVTSACKSKLAARAANSTLHLSSSEDTGNETSKLGIYGV